MREKEGGGEREPEGLRKEEKTRETDGIGRMAKEESIAVTEIGVEGVGRRHVATEQGGGWGIVGEILTGEKIERVDTEGRIDVERRFAQSHHPEGQRVRSLRLRLRRAHSCLLSPSSYFTPFPCIKSV